ncbi:MAG: Ig-like domain-containing protein, partial [Pseudomonadota bacterium]
GSEGDNPETPNTLRVTVLDHYNTQIPAIGASVSFYKPDGKLIAKTLLTNLQGVADFGEVDLGPVAKNSETARVTISVSYQQGDAIRVWTFVDILPGNRVVYVRLPRTACNPQGSLSATFNSNPEGDRARLHPLYNYADAQTQESASASVENGSVEFRDVTVCEDDVQPDGKVTVLSSVFDGNTITAYGFAADQAVGENVLIPPTTANHLPGSVTWSASGIEPDTVWTVASRQGFSHAIYAFGSDPGEMSGTVGVYSAFPSDHWVLLADSNQTSDVSSRYCGIERAYTNPPAHFDVAIADMGVDSFHYDAQSHTFHFPGDYNALTLHRLILRFDTPGFAFWRIHLPPDRIQFQLPQLDANTLAALGDDPLSSIVGSLSPLKASESNYDAITDDYLSVSNSFPQPESLHFCFYEDQYNSTQNFLAAEGAPFEQLMGTVGEISGSLREP